MSQAQQRLWRCNVTVMRSAAGAARAASASHPTIKKRMLYLLLYPLADEFHAFNLFRYITFRSGGAVVTALLISFVFGPPMIAWLKSKQGEGQPIRDDGPQSHIVRKKGTPTMGGFLILSAVTISTLLWADLANAYVWIVAGRDGGLWADRLSRRLPQAYTPVASRCARQDQAVARNRHRCRGMRRAGCLHPPAFRQPGGGAVLQERAAQPRLVLHPVRRLRHCRRVERGQPDRWARRTGDRADDDRGRVFRVHRLSGRQSDLRHIPATPPYPTRRRASGLLRRDGRREPGLSVVQCAAGNGLHG